MVLTFSGFELDSERFELRRSGEVIKVEPRVLEVLLYLTARRDRVVPKDELISEVWGVKFVSESALARCIHELRRALDDDKRPESIIRTVYGRGYRFLAEVEVCSDASFLEDATGGTRAAAAEAVPARQGATEETPRTVRRLALAAAIVAALAVAGWFAVDAIRFRRSASPSASGRVPALTQLTSGIQDAVKPSFSPDGETMLFLAQEPGMPGLLDLYLMPVPEGDPLRLTRGAGASGDLPVFTADGSRVVFSRFRTGEDGSRLPDLWEVSRFGGEPRRYLERASGAGFSPDGAWVAYTMHLGSATPLWLSRVNALDEHRELAPVGFVPRFSPDGAWIAYTTSDPQGSFGRLWIVSPTSGERRSLTEGDHQFYGLSWARDGRSLIFAARLEGGFHLWQVGTTGSYLAPLTQGVGEYSSPTVAPDGKSLVFCSSRPVYMLTMADGPAAAEIRELPQPEHHAWPRLSPGGWRLASVIERPDYFEALYLTDLDTRKQLRLTDQRARHPSWISDDEVAYLAPRADGESTEVRVVNVVTGLQFAWTKFAGDAGWLAVDPDATRLAVVLRTPGAGERIVVRDLRDGREVAIAAGGAYECLRWRPGTDELSWSGPADAGDRGSNGVWMSGIDDPHPVRLASDGYGPCWAEDGGTVYFSSIGGDAGLWQLELDRRRLTLLRTWREVTAFDVAGGRLFFVRSAGRSQIYSMPLDQ